MNTKQRPQTNNIFFGHDVTVTRVTATETNPGTKTCNQARAEKPNKKTTSIRNYIGMSSQVNKGSCKAKTPLD